MLISFLLFACGEKETYPSSTTTDPTTEWDVNPQPESEPSEPAEEPSSEPAEEPSSEPAEEPSSEPAEEPSSEPAEEPSSEPTEAEEFCTLFTETCGTWSGTDTCEDWYNAAPTGTEGDSTGATQACYDYHLDVAVADTDADPSNGIYSMHCDHAAGAEPCVDETQETNGLTLGATILDLGSVDLGASATATLDVTNDAASDITLSALTFSDSAFAVSSSSALDAGSVLAAGSTMSLEVEFTPAMAQSYSETLTISSDSTITPDLSIDLTGTGVEVSTSTYTYAADIAGILGSCMGCHGGSGGFTLTYNNLFTASPTSGMEYITPGDPSQSYLWHKINGTQNTVNGSGSNMANKSGVNLSSTDFSTIETWITEGAPQ